MRSGMIGTNPTARWRAILCLAVSALVAWGCAGRAPTEPRSPTGDVPGRLDAVMAAYHKQGRFDGTVLVAWRGAVVYERAFGLANREWNVANTVDTRYRIASMTKTFTATIVMALIEEGKVRLDAPLSTYLPEYRRDIGDKVTIRHLLGHTSGIPDYVNRLGFWQNLLGNRIDRARLVTDYMSADLEFSPGTEAKYNSTGYYLLGLVIEKVTGKRYEDALREKVLSRAGMAQSGYDAPGRILERRASGYVKTLGAYEAAPHVEIANVFSGGGMYATARDLFAFDRALDTGDILTPATRKTMFEPYFKDTFRGELSFGLGWYVGARQIGSRRVAIIEHGGNTPGFRSLMTRIPGDRGFIVLLANEGSGTFSEEPYRITTLLMNVLYEQPVTMPKKRFADALNEILATEGVAAARRRVAYLEASTEPPGKSDDLNELGYEYLLRGRLDEAILVLELNVQRAPMDANAHDSLGEAYMTKGDKAHAIESYRRSLALDPKNTNAVKMLEKLEAK
jgi:CubicO group peptidase (beta-lactamase class C family)